MKISENPKLNDTYIKSLLNNVIDNIVINIKNLTVIHEDETSHPKFKFFLGLRLDEISINSKQDLSLKTFKVLLIKNLSMFLIPVEANKVFFEFPNSNQSDLDFYAVMQKLSGYYVNLKSSTQKTTENNANNANTITNPYINTNSQDLIEKKTIKDFYIFAPFNLELDLYRDVEQNKYKIEVLIDNFILEIERKQFACLLKMLKTFSKYAEYYENCYMFRKLNFYKPQLKLLKVPENLDARAPAHIAITEQNKIIKKKFHKEVLKNFFTNVRKMITEKKTGIPLYINPIKLAKYKQFFQENYEKFYLSQKKFAEEENPQKQIIMTEIIRYVDTEVLKDWLKEIVGEIYAKQKSEEAKSGFFGGIKSYFYSSAVETIKYDETKYTEKDLSLEARLTIKLSCFSISENSKVSDLIGDRESSGSFVKNSSKFVIKNLECLFNFNDEKAKSLNLNVNNNSINNNNINPNLNAKEISANANNNLSNNNNNNNISSNSANDEKDKSQYINLMDSRVSQFAEQTGRPKATASDSSQMLSFELLIMDLNFNYSTKIRETEFLDEIIIPLNKTKETDHIFALKFAKDSAQNIDLQLSLLSQAFRYNHNFIENISKFFNLQEFEQYSDIINQKTSNLLSFDFDNLQKFYFDSKDLKNKKSEAFNFSVKINHQILIIPFAKGKTSDFNDAFIFDIGELTINNFKNANYSNLVKSNVNFTEFSIADSALSLEESNNFIKYYGADEFLNSPTQSKKFFCLH